jgi:hypothetical protein
VVEEGDKFSRAASGDTAETARDERHRHLTITTPRHPDADGSNQARGRYLEFNCGGLGMGWDFGDR